MGETDINQISGMHNSKMKETKQLCEIDHIERNPTGCLMMSGQDLSNGGVHFALGSLSWGGKHFEEAKGISEFGALRTRQRVQQDEA